MYQMPRAEILGRLLAMQGTIEAMPDDASIAASLMRALREVPGVGDVHVCICGALYPIAPGLDEASRRSAAARDTPSAIDPAELGRLAGAEIVLLATRRRLHGFLAFRPDKPAIFAVYLPFLRNAAGAVASSLEARTHLAELSRVKAELEARVAELAERNARLAAEIGEREELARIVASTAEGIASRNLAGTVTSWNPAAAKIFGWSAEEMIGQTTERLVPADRVEEIALFTRKAVTSGGVERFDTVRVRKDGQHIEVSLSVAPIKDASGKIVGASLICSDVTEQNRAQRYRADTDAILHAISDSSRSEEVLNVVLDRICRYHAASIGRIWKLANGRLHSLAEFAGRPDLQDYLDRSRHVVLTPENSAVARGIETGTSYYRFLEENEDPSHPLLIEMQRLQMRGLVVQPIEFEGERLALSISFDTPLSDLATVAADIQSRMDIIRAAVLRKVSENRLALVHLALDHATDAVLIIEAEPIGEPGPLIVFANAGYYKLTGCTHDETIGARATALLHGPGTDRAQLEKLRQSLRAQLPVTMELLSYRKDGTTFWGERIISPVTNAAGLTSHFIVILRDVTERRRNEAVRQRAETMRTIGQITSGIAHDFNNILTVIELNLSSTQDDPDLENVSRTGVSEALQAVRHGAQLVKSLLAYARGKPASLGPVDLAALFDDVRPILERAGTSMVDVVITEPGDLPPCVADCAQIEAALVNLVLNARDAMPNGGRVTISASIEMVGEEPAAAGDELHPGSFLAISVADTGAGMPPEVLEHVFDPFFTTKASGGTGLGLSQVQSFVHHCGGDIRISSRVGEGTEVVIRLPAAPAGGVSG
jgi:PAS domain S-box-containing protein